MEFCVGETLRKWIDERNDHPEKYPNRRQEATDIIKQVLEAVKYIHAKLRFHRDLKVGYSPKNHSKANTEGKPAYRAQFPDRANFHSIKEMNHFSIVIHNATSDCNCDSQVIPSYEPATKHNVWTRRMREGGRFWTRFKRRERWGWTSARTYTANRDLFLYEPRTGLSLIHEIQFNNKTCNCTVRCMIYGHVSQRQQKTYDRKVDIYAVGLIFFELLWRFGTMAERQEVGEILHISIINMYPNVLLLFTGIFFKCPTQDKAIKHFPHRNFFSNGTISEVGIFRRNSPKRSILK